MNETPRDGNWIDEWGSCKVCGGEIPHGHTNKCDIGKLEQELNEARLGYEVLLQNYNADTISLVASERDQLRKVVDAIYDETQSMVNYCNGDIMYCVTDVRFLKARCLENIKCIDQLPHVQARKMK